MSLENDIVPGRGCDLAQLIESDHARKIILSQAKRYNRSTFRTIDLDDLIQEARITFLNHAMRWLETDRSINFWAWIHTRIGWDLSIFIETDRTVALPSDIKHIRKVERDLAGTYGLAKPEEVAAAAGDTLSPERVQAVRNADKSLASLDKPIDEKGHTLFDVLSDAPRPTEDIALDHIEAEERAGAITAALAELTPLERETAIGVMAGDRVDPARMGRVRRKLKMSLGQYAPKQEPKYLGVSKLRSGDRVRYRADLRGFFGGERIRVYLGVFDNPREAACRIDQEAVARYGRPVNFVEQVTGK
jgi:DNA-directed RNA polymerase specialized sigma subunit